MNSSQQRKIGVVLSYVSQAIAVLSGLIGVLQDNAIKLGIRGFVRICIETCARGCFGAWKYRFRKKGMQIRQMLFICQK